MNILLNALPRTGSKWLCVNLRNYLKRVFRHSARLSVNDAVWPITDWFSQKNDDLLINAHIIPDQLNFVLYGKYLDIETELAHRLKILQKCMYPMAIKVHPTSWYEIVAIEALKPFCQRHFTLRRRNIIEQSISILTCNQTGIWEPRDDLSHTIEKTCNNPFTIDLYDLANILDDLQLKHKYLDSQPNATHIYAEDLFSITTAEQFCQYLRLPYANFEIDGFFGQEYGQHKSQMISNYDQAIDFASSYLK